MNRRKLLTLASASLAATVLPLPAIAKTFSRTLDIGFQGVPDLIDVSMKGDNIIFSRKTGEAVCYRTDEFQKFVLEQEDKDPEFDSRVFIRASLSGLLAFPIVALWWKGKIFKISAFPNRSYQGSLMRKDIQELYKSSIKGINLS